MITVAETIRTARKQAGLTQQQLSNHYAISVRTLSDWETSKRTPPEYVVTLLLRCLAIDFPSAEESLSVVPSPVSEPKETEQAQQMSEPPNKLAYAFYSAYGKPLSPELAELARVEYVAGRVQMVPEVDEDGDPFENKRGKLYLCNEVINGELGFSFRVKEV